MPVTPQSQPPVAQGASVGPLTGVRVVELAGLGPAPHACLILADLGATVVSVLRPGELAKSPNDFQRFMRRGRRIIEADLKTTAGVERVLHLTDAADVLVEGFRPGVTERLGLGPQDLLDRNPRLVYGRVTGWGQEGPWASAAGHDINYLSLTGNLNAIARKGGRPLPPLNLVADFGGGSMLLVNGVLAALFSAQRTGEGQVVDAAMVDGASLLAQMQWAMRGNGQWTDSPGENLLDTGAPFYEVYACADGKFMAVGALEPQFYARFARLLEIDGPEHPAQWDTGRWDELRTLISARFAAQPRAHWAEIFDGTDACVTPVLSYGESLEHPHMRARGTYVSVEGVPQPGAAPRFTATPTAAATALPTELTPDESVWDPR